MIRFFRKIRRNILTKNSATAPAGRATKYLKYAIGEIFLVVIGILIALQINNWNEAIKSSSTEVYVLTEVLSNLNEDALILKEIIEQRQKAKTSVVAMLKYLQKEEINKDSLEKDVVNFLTFERYFPINNAYEILKANGLQLSNNLLTTKISRYYDYEQKKMNRSIMDVEKAILGILENNAGIIRFFESVNLNKTVSIRSYNDKNLKNELYREMVGFKDNNGGTLAKLIVFFDLNKALRNEIEIELRKIKK
ncbi:MULTISPECIES: DUF6090 family protein [unclassified Polaribacter]|uniref:DUF6090 family protein n=1 Tax=unclassified Polaribacter TaxID=196858 RepID=UPI0011BD7517|nr:MULTISPECIES: DUF6090 family protein [unclassified Polaribacter]TXD54377.1 hypothetical protein ES043_00560 [Polaribacter sp. IC063]TXD62792.1 hypothetical protein ES044_00200 [Polaribacter sp. IC066]